MIDKIKKNINNPEELEKLFRNNSTSFKEAFGKIYQDIENTELARFWRIRLNSDKSAEIQIRYSLSDIIVLLSACLLTALLIKIPAILNLKITDLSFYSKNAGIILFFGLTLYSLWSGRITDRQKLIVSALLFLIPVTYINLLPYSCDSSSVNLAYIHLPLLMWVVYGLVWTGFDIKNIEGRIEYIRHNGDLAIILAIIMIAGGIVTAITIGLFSAININIEIFYRDYIVVTGLVAAPIVATYILKYFTAFTNKIAPLIADIFSPVVLITLIAYLFAIVTKGKDPYKDRDYLLIFNIMLLGVMAIIVFSASETATKKRQRFSEIILFCLSIVTLIVDMIALSAIFYRLGEYGISPNRLAVLGSNILIFGNLILITIDLYKVNFRHHEIGTIGTTIAKYIPVYLIWILIVVFGFPLIFGMK